MNGQGLTVRNMAHGLRTRINDRLDQLQIMMEEQKHLDDKGIGVLEHIETISKFWSILSEEDRDYIQGCQYAIDEQIEWK